MLEKKRLLGDADGRLQGMSPLLSGEPTKASPSPHTIYLARDHARVMPHREACILMMKDSKALRLSLLR